MNEATFEKIVQYLSGELCLAERLNFESAIEGDKELAQMIELCSTSDKQMHQDKVYDNNEMALKKTLAALSAKYFFSGDNSL